MAGSQLLGSPATTNSAESYKRMKSIKKFILTVFIFIFSIVSAAFADTVVLKNGRS